MSFEVTVLGCSGSFTGPGRACSGYLFTADGTALLVDCGNGSTANLQRLTRFEDVDAILVTHRHIDHCADLVSIFNALRYHSDGPRRVTLYAAPEVAGQAARLRGGDADPGIEEVFDVVEVDGGDVLTVGPMHLRLARSVHSAPTVSVRVEVDGASVVYSSDSAGGPDLVALATGADLLLCEATWQGDASDYPAGLHLTAAGAGEIATAAGVGQLVLTHIQGSLDRHRSLAEARATFAGDVSLADDLRSWRLR